jgi:hypothetical protein
MISFGGEKPWSSHYWLRQTAYDQEVVGLNPGTIYWIEVSHNASYAINEKFKNKGSRMGHIKKIFKKVMLSFGYRNQK